MPRYLLESHQTAAVRWSLDLLVPPAVRHVTVPRNRSRVVLPDAVVHRAEVSAADQSVLGGTPVTSPLRTVLDLARTLPLPEGVAVVDSSLRTGRVHLRMLQRRAAVAAGPGSDRLRRAVALADARSESILESYCRAVLVAASCAPEETQYVVRDGRGREVARVDLAWPSYRLVVEVDGFAFHADRADYRRDRRRQNAVELEGWLVLRFSWEDVVGNPDYVVASVSAALASLAA